MCVWVCVCVYSEATWLEGNHVGGRVDKFTFAKHKHTRINNVAPNSLLSLAVHSSELPDMDLKGNVLRKICTLLPRERSVKLDGGGVRHSFGDAMT